MQVSEILAIKGSALYTISPEKKLDEAVKLLTELDAGSLVCFGGGRVAGMLTFREVLRAVNAHGSDWNNVKVADVMVRDPAVVDPTASIDDLRRMMIEEHQRYLPVMDGDTLMGVVSFHDVAKAVLEAQSFENKMLKAYIRDWPDENKKAAS
jgi:CBS domain-containing protein